MTIVCKPTATPPALKVPVKMRFLTLFAACTSTLTALIVPPLTLDATVSSIIKTKAIPLTATIEPPAPTKTPSKLLESKLLILTSAPLISLNKLILPLLVELTYNTPGTTATVPLIAKAPI